MAEKNRSAVSVLQTVWCVHLDLVRADAAANFVTHSLMAQLRQLTIESRIRKLHNSFKCLAVVILVC